MDIQEQPSYSYRKSIIISIFGVIFLFVGLLSEGGPSIWYILGRFAAMLAVYVVILGVVAIIITLTMKASKKDGFSIFAILFLAAGMFAIIPAVCK